MKKLILICILFVLQLFCNAQVTDIDGNTYKTMTYENTTFFINYLRTTKYNDGTEIPNITNQNVWNNLKTGAYCDFENNPYESINYGRLYNFYAVETKKLCPLGWHINTPDEGHIIISAWDTDTTIRRASLRRKENGFVAPLTLKYFWWWDSDLSDFTPISEQYYSLTYGTEIICVQDPNFAKITASKTTICPNENTVLSVETLSGFKAYKYLWLPDSLTTQTIIVSPQQHTIYTLIIKDRNGYINYLNYDIWVLVNPVADFSFNYNTNSFVTELHNNTKEIKFNDGTLITNRYIWDIDDEKTKIPQDNEESISYEFDKLGEHSVTLWAINSLGCKDSITKIINTSEFPYISVPSAFSPNNDGLNDVLYAVGRNIENITFIIYDRWGQKVFESNSLTNGWDGTFNGKPLEAAVYMYYISGIATYDEKKIEQKGDITIIK